MVLVKKENESIYNPLSISQALCNSRIDINWTCSDSSIIYINIFFYISTIFDINIDLGKLLGSTGSVFYSNNIDKVSKVIKMPYIENMKMGSKLFQFGLESKSMRP